MKRLVYRIISAILRPLGYSIHNTRYFDSRLRRPTLEGALRQLKQAGLSPATIFDAGAAEGTPALYHTFPDVTQILVEPLVEDEAPLKELVRRYPRMRLVMAAAGRQAGTAEINVYRELDSTSFYSEAGVDTIPRTIPVVTLDDVCAEHRAPGPFSSKWMLKAPNWMCWKAPHASSKKPNVSFWRRRCFIFARAPRSSTT